MEANKRLLENYMLYAIGSSALIGVAFIYLFLWKDVGISHLLFYVLVTVNAFVPALVWEPSRLKNIRGLSVVLLGIALMISSLFIFRLQVAPLTWAFITLPVIYSATYATIYNPGVVSRLGLLSYLSLPAIMLASWFADGVNFLLKFRIGSIKSPRTRSIIKRVIAGFFLALPLLFLFTVLMVSADYAFADLIEDTLRKIFGDWIKIENLVKLFIGALVAIYFMVFNFSIWNKESALTKFLTQHAESKVIKIKQSWDPLIFSVLLGLVNLLFLTFISVQFVYLFGGEDTVFEGGYTYAEYARRGFKELLLIAILVYGLVYILNLKVKTYTKSQLAIYKVNFLLLLLMALVINVSAHTRLYLTEEAYGFTGVRIMGHFIMALVGVMVTLLASFSLWKESFAYINKVNAAMIFIGFCAYLIFPGDYLVAKLNTDRFKETGQMDLPYMLSLSDEAVPFFIELVEYDETPTVAKSIIYGELSSRKDANDRKKWQSFNLFNAYNQNKIEDALKDQPDDILDPEESLKSFLADYEEMLSEGKFEEAHEKFWTKTSQFNDSDELEKLKITKYENLNIPKFDEWAILDLAPVDLSGSRASDSASLNYWSGMYIDIDMEYRYLGDSRFYETSCRYESLNVKLEDGEWRITYASQFPIGLPDYQNPDAYYYGYQEDAYTNLFDSSWSGCY